MNRPILLASVSKQKLKEGKLKAGHTAPSTIQ
jgi:hypothetical protein